MGRINGGVLEIVEEAIARVAEKYEATLLPVD
jgi:hypothetical protein